MLGSVLTSFVKSVSYFSFNTSIAFQSEYSLSEAARKIYAHENFLLIINVVIFARLYNYMNNSKYIEEI